MSYARENAHRQRLDTRDASIYAAIVRRPARRPYYLSFRCPECGQHRGSRVHRAHVKARTA